MPNGDKADDTQATTARTSAAATTTATSWQMWVPCIGMALCSWLSFVDRQVLNILSPTIIEDTGLTPQDFTTATSFFFLTYTLGNPVWGSVLDRVGLRVGMLLAVGVWTAASMSHASMASFAGFALARAVLGLGEGGTFPGGLRTAVETLPREPARARHRAVLQRRHDRRGHDAAAARTTRDPVRLEDRLPRHRRPRRAVDGDLGGHRASAVPAEARAHAAEDARGRTSRERRVWALMFSYALPAISPGPVLTILAIYLDAAAAADAGRREQRRLDSAAHLGHRLLLLGLGRRSLRRQQPAADRHVHAAHRGLAHAGPRDDDHVRADRDRD